MESLKVINDSIFNAENFKITWEKVFNENEKQKSMPISMIIENFFGSKDYVEISKNLTVNHRAFYIGDYLNEEIIEMFCDYLKSNIEIITDLEYGPSYIAPKEYNTPGWWISITLNGDCAIELFSCKSFGMWANKSNIDKYSLMSHSALEYKTLEEYNEILYKLSQIDFLKNIMSKSSDKLGHTYTHFRNLNNNKVLEIIYCEHI